jgi:phosphopantothenoylcysteine decarboxylase/phosphopantothenate--cysteine ligase
MGYALAAAAQSRGAVVALITGPTELPPPTGLATTTRVETTAEMQHAVQALVKDADALIMSAAPADYRPKEAAATKRPRGNGALTVELEATPDILASLKRRKGLVVVGFALETGNGLAHARSKMQNKALDFVILNDALEPGAGFEVTTNRVTILGPGGKQVDLPLLPKRDVAERILDVVEEAL